jgi:hypothetical protein
MAEAGPRAALERVQELADYTVPLAVRVVCGMRLADRLADGPLPVAELADLVGADPDALRRLLRALAGRGLFRQEPPDRFGLTDLGQFLRGDHPLSVRDAYPMLPADLAAWAALEHSVRTGEAAFPLVHGRDYYAHLAANPADSTRVDRSVEAQNRLVLRTLARAHDWAGCGTIVDVAGGTGTFLAGLLRRHRKLRGVLVDLPHVTGPAAGVLRAAGVDDRCEIRPGSIFDPLPAGHDTYLLKTVLHDWKDEAAGAVLRRVRAAVRPDSRLLVLEALLPADGGFHIGTLLDLHSLVLVGGPDRDLDALTALLGAAGFEVVSAAPTATLAVIEARPV